jgi:hypothetical protein
MTRIGEGGCRNCGSYALIESGNERVCEACGYAYTLTPEEEREEAPNET